MRAKCPRYTGGPQSEFRSARGKKRVCFQNSARNQPPADVQAGSNLCTPAPGGGGGGGGKVFAEVECCAKVGCIVPQMWRGPKCWLSTLRRASLLVCVPRKEKKNYAGSENTPHIN
eukprot:1155838-Pelagomonas_calceolata.AAC.4